MMARSITMESNHGPAQTGTRSHRDAQIQNPASIRSGKGKRERAQGRGAVACLVQHCKMEGAEAPHFRARQFHMPDAGLRPTRRQHIAARLRSQAPAPWQRTPLLGRGEPADLVQAMPRQREASRRGCSTHALGRLGLKPPGGSVEVLKIAIENSGALAIGRFFISARSVPRAIFTLPRSKKRLQQSRLRSCRAADRMNIFRRPPGGSIRIKSSPIPDRRLHTHEDFRAGHRMFFGTWARS